MTAQIAVYEHIFVTMLLLVIFAQPISASDSWTRSPIDPWTKIIDPHTIASILEVYNNKLYAGTSDASGTFVYVYDGTSWNVSYNGPNISEQPIINFLKVYNNKLYAGITTIYNLGDTPHFNRTFYVYDGNSWAVSNSLYDATKRVTEHAQSFVVYNNKLFVGTMGDIDFNGKIYAYDGTTWTVSYDPPGYTTALTVYDGKLYAAQNVEDALYKVPNAIIYVYDGESWSEIHNIPKQDILSMAAYNNKLYVGGAVGTSRYGITYVYDGKNWVTIADFAGPLAVYGNKLYVGTSTGGRQGNPRNYIYSYDGTSWTVSYAESYDKPEKQVYSFAVSNNKLYAATSGGIYELDTAPLTPATTPIQIAMPTVTPPSTQIPALTSASTSKQCDSGCIYDDSCLPFGTRLAANGGTYCDPAKKTMDPQKNDGALCQNNYECLSNYCTNGACGNIQKELQETRSLLQTLLDFFRTFFDKIKLQ